MAGVSAPDVNDDDSIASLQACLEMGINFIDTAYCYGPNGESENLVRRALSKERDKYVLATKGGIHYGNDGKQTQDARPQTIKAECDESLKRLGVDHVELYYLHSPDPQVPIAESAGAIADLVAVGKVKYAGASNCQLDQIQEFHSVCPLTAVQLPYNMLQREIEQQTVPWCQQHGVAVVVYWALMKGLLAGRLTRIDQLDEQDSRRNYPMYQGEEWEQNQAFVATLRELADECDKSVAEVVVNWTIHQPGITVALCGARRRWQIEESAAALGWKLNDQQRLRIERAMQLRGKAAAKRLFR